MHIHKKVHVHTQIYCPRTCTPMIVLTGSTFLFNQEFIMAGKIIGWPRIASRSRFKRSTIDGEGKKQIVSALRVILQAEPLAAG